MLSPTAIRDAYKNNQAATCVLLCQRWLLKHPDDIGVFHDYATTLYEMARYDEAISVYYEMLQRFPDNHWAIYNQLGHLHRYRGALSEAESAYQQAINIDPEEAASYIFLGAVQARQGKHKEAERTHRLATFCPEGLIDEAYLNLGLVLRGQGRYEDAKQCFEKAIELTHDYSHAMEALKDVNQAIALEELE